MRRCVLPLLMLLSACGHPADERRAGDVSPDDRQALNDAAAMLDADSVTANQAGTEPHE